MTAITSESFGKTKDGKDVFLYTLRAGEVTVTVLNIGCSVKDILVPDKDGNITDVNLGYDNAEDYEANISFLGCICGRVANRIAAGTFTLDGVNVEVSKNDPLGNNICHGGFIGLTRRCFDGNIDGSKLVLTYVDEDGAEGFPGDVSLTVTYELTEEAGLMMDYKATTTKPTPIDLSNHFLANLAGHAAGNIDNHVLTINSTQKLQFDKKFIPTGTIQDTEGTAMGFSKPTLLADVLDKQERDDGLNLPFILPGEKGTKKCVGRLLHPDSKRFMDVYTTEPLAIAYSGYYLEFLLKGKKCKGGKTYEQSGGFLIMPQGYPDAVNHPEFPSCILRPGETYHTTTWYKFGVEE